MAIQNKQNGSPRCSVNEKNQFGDFFFGNVFVSEVF